MVENGINNHKAISKSELAQKYGVHISTLMRWINGNDQLLEKLKKIGYKKHRNLFNSREILLIMEYLG